MRYIVQKLGTSENPDLFWCTADMIQFSLSYVKGQVKQQINILLPARFSL